MKKLIFLILTLSLILALPLNAQESLPYIDDQADILTPLEEEQLTTLAAQASSKVDCGIYVVTVEDYTEIGNDPYLFIETILKDYYSDQGYGTGENRDGVILMLSMRERDYSLYTHGFGDSGLSDPAMDHLVDTFLRDFSHDSWYDGFADYITCTEELLQMTLDGDPYDEFTISTPGRILGYVLSTLIAFLIASLITAFYVKQMKSVAMETHAEEFAGKLDLSHRDDRYTHTTTTRVYDPPSSSSSGGSRSRSGGSSRSGKF